MVVVVVTRFFPGRRTLPLLLVCFASSARGFDLTVYTASSGSTVATGILSVVVVSSGVVVGGGRVVGFPGNRRFGADWYFGRLFGNWLCNGVESIAVSSFGSSDCWGTCGLFQFRGHVYGRHCLVWRA